MALVGREIPADLAEANTVAVAIRGVVILVCVCVALRLAMDFSGELQWWWANRQGRFKPIIEPTGSCASDDEHAAGAGWQVLVLVVVMVAAGGDIPDHLRAGNVTPAIIDGCISLLCLCAAIPLSVKFVRGRRWFQRENTPPRGAAG